MLYQYCKGLYLLKKLQEHIVLLLLTSFLKAFTFISVLWGCYKTQVLGFGQFGNTQTSYAII